MEFRGILEELGWPNVYLLTPEQFEHVEGDKVGSDFGISSVKYPVLTLRKGLRGRCKRNIIYHEIGHIIFPNRRPWWVECFAERMANGGGQGYYAKRYGPSIEELPPRSYLLRLARFASARLNRKGNK